MQIKMKKIDIFCNSRRPFLLLAFQFMHELMQYSTSSNMHQFKFSKSTHAKVYKTNLKTLLNKHSRIH